VNNHSTPSIAYFSMEIALESSIPTYSGGLGVLAGDTVRSAADLGLPMVAVTFVHRAGYFRQRLDQAGNQSEEPDRWDPQVRLGAVDVRTEIEIEQRLVRIRAWRYRVKGVGGAEVPVYLLDTALEENDERDRGLTDSLYGGDPPYRLAQEAVLGIGGLTFLRNLHEYEIGTYHLNEGHSALLILSLLGERLYERLDAMPTETDLDAVRQRCVFTTHTPIPAGHDRFPYDLVRSVLGERRTTLLANLGALDDGELNMTHLALRGSRYVNGVAKRHSQISQELFPNVRIKAITNGVHALTWTSLPFAELYDRRISEWRRDNLYLRYAETIPVDEIEEAHRTAKGALLEEVRRRTGVALDPEAMTIGFARRAAAYKRADMLFWDLDRLRQTAEGAGPLQVIYAGKSHPKDGDGREVIRRVFAAKEALEPSIRVVYLENYDMALAAQIVAGVDVWLNTPLRPMEASASSTAGGLKAASRASPAGRSARTHPRKPTRRRTRRRCMKRSNASACSFILILSCTRRSAAARSRSTARFLTRSACCRNTRSTRTAPNQSSPRTNPPRGANGGLSKAARWTRFRRAYAGS
jgi:starch phosphorylase